VSQFLSQIPPRFAQAELPQRGIRCDRAKLLSLLGEMFNADQNEDGIIFTA